MYRSNVRDDLDVKKIRMVYDDSSVYQDDSVVLCQPITDDINLMLHSATGSRNTYMLKNIGYELVFVYIVPEDTFDVNLGDDVFSFLILFPYESILITDYAPGSWVMLDFHTVWPFRMDMWGWWKF